MPTSNDTYVNPTLGIKVTKPSGWQYVTAEQNAENLARGHLKDEHAAARVRETATAPLVAMVKHPEPYEDLNPSFKIHVKPLQHLPADDPKKLLGVIAGPLSDMFNDYTVVTPPTDTTVAGLKAAYLKIHYSLTDPDGRSFQTCSELWVVPRGRFFFMIGAGTRQDEATGTRSEIRAIINSLVIEPQ